MTLEEIISYCKEQLDVLEETINEKKIEKEIGTEFTDMCIRVAEHFKQIIGWLLAFSRFKELAGECLSEIKMIEKKKVIPYGDDYREGFYDVYYKVDDLLGNLSNVCDFKEVVDARGIRNYKLKEITEGRLYDSKTGETIYNLNNFKISKVKDADCIFQLSTA